MSVDDSRRERAGEEGPPHQLDPSLRGRNGGHEQEFALLAERYGRELRAHARRIVRADRVDDAVQQALLAAWSSLRGGTEVEDVRAWLHRILHNAALDMVAARAYDDQELPATLADSRRTDALAEQRLEARAALSAVADLPVAQRRALTLTAIQGRSGRDAARALGIAEAALRQIVRRARLRAREAVGALVPVWTAGASSPGASEGIAGGGAGAAAVKFGTLVGIVAVAVGGTGGALRYAGAHPHARPHASAPATTPRPRLGRVSAAAPPVTSTVPARARPATGQPVSYGAVRVVHPAAPPVARHTALVRRTAPETAAQPPSRDLSHGTDDGRTPHAEQEPAAPPASPAMAPRAASDGGDGGPPAGGAREAGTASDAHVGSVAEHAPRPGGSD